MKALHNSARSRVGRPAQKEGRRGAALVEMAIVLPIFVTLLLGMIEFGRALMVGQLVTNAAREGARAAIVDGSTNTSVSDDVKNFLASATGTAASNVTVSITVNGTANGNVATATAKQMITIDVSIPFSKVSYLPATYLKNATLSGKAAMRHE